MKLIGIDHVGISSDFDGGGGVDGWNGADETFNVTLELVRRGYTEAQIAKIWSGNLLRVMDEVQAVARKKPAVARAEVRGSQLRGSVESRASALGPRNPSPRSSYIAYNAVK